MKFALKQLSDDKVIFIRVMPDERAFTEYRDIGGGDGCMEDYLRKSDSCQGNSLILQTASCPERKSSSEIVPKPDAPAVTDRIDRQGILWYHFNNIWGDFLDKLPHISACSLPGFRVGARTGSIWKNIKDEAIHYGKFPA